ncbi:UbiX family flavin prenyltransferase [Geobacter sp. SVR]|uniref:UbiX family flavin prenyltransferase n=1 Tax=Geobacter sp. SVR TaxID=2495594 RepID=UPI00143EFB69|nr:flavin prenyltransferase UbiX [Geobacter sp. SVR]BCS51749.1 flavin prenyltransferase UbiX [Geobacter sp. SVR]GCF84936.1 flavin prenyltransferase UbiX [Geobacter sp. SVR]
MKPERIFLALTGASGTVYGLRLAEELCRCGCRLTVTVSASGLLVCREETGLDLSGDPVSAAERLQAHFGVAQHGLRLVASDDFFVDAASGSAAPDAMIVAPCSMGTLARIAGGISGNLIERAADVMLKERRPLLLVPRETPLSEIHLENMLKLARAGARIIPAMPAFYHQPETVDDMVNFVVGKVLEQLGLQHALYRSWER